MCCFCFIFHFVVIDVHVFVMFSYVSFMFIRSTYSGSILMISSHHVLFHVVVSSRVLPGCSIFLMCSSFFFCCLQGVFIRPMFLIVLSWQFLFWRIPVPYPANLPKTEEGVSRSVASAARRVTLPTANFHLQSLHTCPLETLLGGIGTLAMFFSMMYRGIVYCILCIIFAGQTPTMINPWWICFCRFRLITVDVAIPQVKLSQWVSILFWFFILFKPTI